MAESGARRRMRWQSFPQVAEEIAGPVRSFSSYRGQTNFSGWYWSATLGRRVGFESWVERDHLVALDFDPSVSDVVSQPFTLLWDSGGRRSRRHTPDFLVRLDSGHTLVLDSRPFERIKDRDREAFTATAQACGDVGWEYAVWDRLDPVLTANPRWLGRYRHPRCFDERVARELLRVFARPQELIDGAEAAGDPLGTLPVLYHLMWRRWLLADLSLVLSHRTLVRVSPRVADLAEVADLASGWSATVSERVL
ncbi:TnsA-like heteromeric transposase endonuclease subunit [Nocardia amamiensis]|uniref:TnsA-like heteromeric transposase endonuclease subunit n=1 Tax=Nocardia amamiensis TaxID=404578 RepID=UPI002B4B55A0|nr:TnsA-like heteromeric transposase endonuclease subunit [Nocardia amamiensis]